MSLYDRLNASPNHDTTGWAPLEPEEFFREDAAAPLTASQWPNRFMYRTGVGIVQSVGGVWVAVTEPRTLFVPAMDAVAGATAGWLVTGADDGLARLPAAETSSTLVIPIRGINVGDTIQAVRVLGQVESAGANATLVMSVRKSTAVVGDFTDAELDTANIGTVTADTLISAAVLEVTALGEVLGALESVYVLLTGTTAALTDIAIAGVQVDVLRA